jgi:xylan 1,4-beta-xylosidase
MSRLPDSFRLRALPAPNPLRARGTVTHYLGGGHALAAVTLDASGLRPGESAGLALLNRPYAWLGFSRRVDGLFLVQFDERTGRVTEHAAESSRARLRAACDFDRGHAIFGIAAGGGAFRDVGEPCVFAEGATAGRAVACAIFCVRAGEGEPGGHADFASFDLAIAKPPAP